MRTLTRLWIRLDWRARTSLRQRSTSNTACRNLTSSQSLGRKVCSSMQRDVGSVCTRYLVWKNGTHCVNAFLTGLFYPHRTHQFQGQACRGLQEEPHRDGWAWDKTCQGEQHNTAPCCIRLGMSLCDLVWNVVVLHYWKVINLIWGHAFYVYVLRKYINQLL